MAFERLGRYEEAGDAFAEAIRLKPRAYNHVLLGAVLKKVERFDEAISQCLKALQLEPNNEEAYLNIALAYQAQQKYSEAIENLDRAIAIDPEYSSAYAALGSTYESMGDKELARIYYEKAWSLAPAKRKIKDG